MGVIWGLMACLGGIHLSRHDRHSSWLTHMGMGWPAGLSCSSKSWSSAAPGKPNHDREMKNPAFARQDKQAAIISFWHPLFPLCLSVAPAAAVHLFHSLGFHSFVSTQEMRQTVQNLLHGVHGSKNEANCSILFFSKSCISEKSVCIFEKT